mmetsp:Transcript_26792/g.83198  ORF Transcript_26792/g.83198 Transcript_26792/m.83198 type:complete len:98 (-) Transcript_26792:39-332(-)
MKQAYEVKGVQVLGASADGQADNKRFSQKFGFNFPLLCDTARAIPEALGVTSRRWGVLVSEDRKILEFWPDVSPADFPIQPLTWIANSEWQQRSGEL